VSEYLCALLVCRDLESLEQVAPDVLVLLQLELLEELHRLEV